MQLAERPRRREVVKENASTKRKTQEKDDKGEDAAAAKKKKKTPEDNSSAASPETKDTNDNNAKEDTEDGKAAEMHEEKPGGEDVKGEQDKDVKSEVTSEASSVESLRTLLRGREQMLAQAFTALTTDKADSQTESQLLASFLGEFSIYHFLLISGFLEWV